MNNNFNLMLVFMASIVSFGCGEGTSSAGSNSGIVLEIIGFHQPYNIYKYEDSEYKKFNVYDLKTNFDDNMTGGAGYSYIESKYDPPDGSVGVRLAAQYCYQLFFQFFSPDGGNTNDDDEVDLTPSEWEDWFDFRSEVISDVCCPEGSQYVGELDQTFYCMF